jgi:chaperonin GroES
MKLRPLQDRIVVKRIAADEKSPGGILIPDSAKGKSIEGEVLAVGAGVKIGVEVGEHVVFGPHAGTEINVEGVALLVLKEADVFGVAEAG